MEKIRSHYEQKERDKVDFHKNKLREDSLLLSRYKYEAVSVPPSVARQFGRMVLDTLLVKSILPNLHKRSQDKRNKEAMYIALKEYEAERQAELDELERQRQEEEIEYKRQKAASDERKRIQEKDLFDRDIINGMDNYRYRQDQKIKGERIQELSEKSFNNQLTRLEYIDTVCEAGDQEISKRQLSYNGKEITVYDMKGFSFSFLQHAIDFKGHGEEDNLWRIGARTAKNLQDNPAMWTESRDDQATYGGGSDALSDTISTSYVNTDKNFRGIDWKGIFYGFDHVNPNSILQIGLSDIGSTNGIGKYSTYLKDGDQYLPEMLERKGDTSPYNEVQIKRFDDSGKPHLPDYIITKNGNFNETTLKHAAFFNIPIINIETKYYRDKEAHRLSNLLETVNENSSYDQIKSALDDMNSSFLTDHHIEESIVGLWDKPPIEQHHLLLDNESLAEQMKKFTDLELTKRIDFIKLKLIDKTNKMIEAMKNNDYTEFFDDEIGIVRKWDYGKSWVGDSMHRLDIQFRTDNKQLYSESQIYDGGHPSPEITSRYAGANSKYYDELEPIVNAYLETENSYKQARV